MACPTFTEEDDSIPTKLSKLSRYSCIIKEDGTRYKIDTHCYTSVAEYTSYVCIDDAASEIVLPDDNDDGSV